MSIDTTAAVQPWSFLNPSSLNPRRTRNVPFLIFTNTTKLRRRYSCIFSEGFLGFYTWTKFSYPEYGGQDVPPERRN